MFLKRLFFSTVKNSHKKQNVEPITSAKESNQIPGTTLPDPAHLPHYPQPQYAPYGYGSQPSGYQFGYPTASTTFNSSLGPSTHVVPPQPTQFHVHHFIHGHCDPHCSGCSGMGATAIPSAPLSHPLHQATVQAPGSATCEAPVPVSAHAAASKHAPVAVMVPSVEATSLPVVPPNPSSGQVSSGVSTSELARVTAPNLTQSNKASAPFPPAPSRPAEPPSASTESTEAVVWDRWPDGVWERTYSETVANDNDNLAVHWACEVLGGEHNQGDANAQTPDDGVVTKRRCLGVFQCTNPSCTFLIRPPTRPAARKKLSDSTCAICSKPMEYKACGVLMKLTKYSAGVLASHSGFHKHPHPPRLHLTRGERGELRATIQLNPTASSFQLMTGVPGRASVTQISEVLANKARVTAERRPALDETGQGSAGDTFIAQMRMLKEDCPDFVVGENLLGGPDGDVVISVQTPFMAAQCITEVLRDDPVNGFITDGAHRFWANKSAVLICSSTYCPEIKAWIPILLSYANGQTAEHFKRHFLPLFNCVYQQCGLQGVKFVVGMLANVLDHSEAQRIGFIAAFVEFCHQHDLFEGDEEVIRREATRLLRGCEEHFRQGITRLKKDGSIVPHGQRADFDAHVRGLFEAVDIPAFNKAADRVSASFPEVSAWLDWWMRPEHASMLFPAWRRMDEDQWNSLPNTTNAEESLHYRFYLAGGKGRQKLVPGLKILYNIAGHFERVYNAAIKGQKIRYGEPEPWKEIAAQIGRTHKSREGFATSYKSDGRAPDTRARLEKAKEAAGTPRRLQRASAVLERRPGAPWFRNSCWLDASSEVIFQALALDGLEMLTELGFGLPLGSKFASFINYMIARLERINETNISAVLGNLRNTFRRELALPADAASNYGAMNALLGWYHLCVRPTESNNYEPNTLAFFNLFYTRLRVCTGDKDLYEAFTTDATHLQLETRATLEPILNVLPQLHSPYKGNIQQWIWDILEHKGTKVETQGACWKVDEEEQLCVGQCLPAPELYFNLPVLLILEQVRTEKIWNYPLVLKPYPRRHVVSNQQDLVYDLVGRMFLRGGHYTARYSIDRQHVYEYDSAQRQGEAQLLEGAQMHAKFALAGEHRDTQAVLYRLRKSVQARERLHTHQTQTLSEEHSVILVPGLHPVPILSMSRAGVTPITGDYAWKRRPGRLQDYSFQISEVLPTDINATASNSRIGSKPHMRPKPRPLKTPIPMQPITDFRVASASPESEERESSLSPVLEPATPAIPRKRSLSTTSDASGNLQISPERLTKRMKSLELPDLCPFCDQVFPINPSAELVALRKRLEKLATPLPSPANPNGMDIKLLTRLSFCQMHRSESSVIPEGIARGWPTRIDFAAIPARIQKHRGELQRVIDQTDSEASSPFYRAALRPIRALGAKAARSIEARQEFFHQYLPGYYGNPGVLILRRTLEAMFQELSPVLCEPLSPAEFIEQVLVPEGALLLIQEDMAVDRLEALRNLVDSRKYGLAQFSEDAHDIPLEARPDVAEVLQDGHSTIENHLHTIQEAVGGEELSHQERRAGRGRGRGRRGRTVVHSQREGTRTGLRSQRKTDMN